MAKLRLKELKEWEASRDLVTELERSVREMEAGKAANEHRIKIKEAPATSRNRSRSSPPSSGSS
jgi:hypothetical protein